MEKNLAPLRPSPPSLQQIKETLYAQFRYEDFRAFQQEICEELLAGHSAILVMPTGAGKSLCYQLPSLFLPRPVLVISPLVALMEDQVNKLNAFGVAARCIHGLKSRDESREAAQLFRDGQLKLLYIAPERLSVSGFIEFLEKYPPSLIAVDEAHCISQWGHDFRPDYRLIGDRLAHLPVQWLALTATAAPQVQQDIVRQLKLVEPRYHVHGFRRRNLWLHVSESKPSTRVALARKILAVDKAKPAIIYVQSRRVAEDTAKHLAGKFAVGLYHAGLAGEVRHAAQKDFYAGKTQVMVATVAFGMGVDKADIRTILHFGVPSSVENYYQEIGRAGRDGEESQAYLLYSEADRYLQEFLLEKSYPPLSSLERVIEVLTRGPLREDELALYMPKDQEDLPAAVGKLISYKIVLRSRGMLTLAHVPEGWSQSYGELYRWRKEQLELVLRFARGKKCRMLQILKHFGDLTDKQGACGKCDNCVGGWRV